MGPAEKALEARGINLTPLVFDDPSEDTGQDGHIVVWFDDDGGLTAVAMVRDGLSASNRDGVANYMVATLERFVEHGPEPDDWQLRLVDGGWERWIRNVPFHYAE
jgi:hypothetical protein